MADEKKRNKGGRPLKFKSAKELQQKIDEYFESCYEERWVRDDETGEWKPVYDRHGNIIKDQVRPFTITGLAVFLGTTRETLLDYEDRDEFSYTIKAAKQRIENFTEEQLFTNRNTTGVIFNLKNNYGWTDKSEVDTNIGNKDGKPFETQSNINLSGLSVEELRQLEHILSKTSES